MSSTTPLNPSVGEGEGHLRRVLGVPSLVLFGLVYMVPLTVFTPTGSSPWNPLAAYRWRMW